MVASELPQEILIDIFSRLPAKFVGRCRCLSKPWNDILSSPQFIKAHLNRKTHQQSLLLLDESRSIHSIATIKDVAVSRELPLPFGCTEILGSCHGLVLLVNKEGNKFLVNPVTLEMEIIPNNSSPDEAREIFSMHGFGYDSSIDDYKSVTLSVEVEDEDENEQAPEIFVDVYFVKRGVWKRVEICSPYNHAICEPYSGAFLNGAIHWLAISRDSSYRLLLLAFSLFDEVVTEIPTLDDIQMGDFWLSRVVVLGGCLCIIDRKNVWMMKQYGLVESWTKLSIDICGKSGSWTPLCFVGDQEMVSIVKGRNLGLYNQKEGTLRDMIVNGGPAVFEDGVMFVPSLVSPAYGNNTNRDA